ncbi:hypothetical protein [Niallia sp. FSL R7-0271]|uniref:hypothetical protein n=1 Tax=Niallia sp. FSL R7-0271 TaxID=2921678 RepID=UPI0030F65DDF
MQLKLVDIYFDKAGSQVKGFIFKTPNKRNLGFNKVYLSQHRLYSHIIHKHPEITEEKIMKLVEDPDYVLSIKEKDRSKKYYHFRRKFNDIEYTAVVLKGYLGQMSQTKAYLLSAYILKEEKKVALLNNDFKVAYEKGKQNNYEFHEDRHFDDPSMFDFDFVEE